MLNWLDIFAGIALVIALINGYKKGLVMQAVGYQHCIGCNFWRETRKNNSPELL